MKTLFLPFACNARFWGRARALPLAWALLLGWLPTCAQTFLGLTLNGGADNRGAIVQYDNTTTSLSVAASFPITTPGKSPSFTEMVASGGKLYGMTPQGGANNVGVIFEWDPATNTFTKQVDFDGAAKGSSPTGSLTLSGGKLYGMTYSGGTNSLGVLFEWDPSTNTFTKKVDFDGTAKGSNPSGSLTLSGGKFYGTTSNGGASNLGALFEWDPATNVFTKQVDFDGAAKGRNPFGNLTLSGSKFYGMTQQGGTNNVGVLFEWNPTSNTFIKKVDFDGATNGCNPYGSLTLSGGKFYGITYYGGANNFGVLFEWDPTSNTFTKQVDFDGAAKGSNPKGSLTLSGGKFYGMTYYGGANSLGVLFEWDPTSNTFTKQVDFDGAAKGSNPGGSLTLSGGKLYGMTSKGGTGIGGVLFEWDPGINALTKRADFDGAVKGSNPYGNLTPFGGKFYGVTPQGGANGLGVIFEWDPVTSTFTKQVDFDGTAKGSYPQGSLTLSGGKLYGMTQQGGANNLGVLFEWDPITNVFINQVDFDGAAKGNYPLGSLTLSGGKFYGMTNAGGANNVGVIFEWDPATSTFTNKVDFDGAANGRYPYGSLTLFGGKFYGMTPQGGANSLGVLFEWDPTSNTFIKQVDFDGVAKGSTPRGSLAESGGKLYGMTRLGGANAKGTLFEWDPANGAFTNKVDFDGTAKGRYPTGSLTLSGGKFYGMTTLGGTNDQGVIFEWDPVNNIFSKKADFNGTNGRSPSADLTVVPPCSNPTLNTPPAALLACAGSPASFSVAATGSNLTYQWQVNTGSGFSNIINGGVYTNAATATLSLTGVTAGMNSAVYQCIVTSDGACSVTSNTATLSVGTLPGAVLASSSTTRTANAECTDGIGWTHYYNTSSNEILLSVKKNGNAIGTVGVGGFAVTSNTNAAWGTGAATTISALYVTSANGWQVMNRWWNVTPTTQPTTDVQVRTYFAAQDLADLNGSISGTDITATQLKFYKINGGNASLSVANPHDGVLAASAYDQTGYWEYANGPTASSSAWALGSLGSASYAEYTVRSFSGGGGGGNAGGGSAFPVEFVGVSATWRKAGYAARVEWATASELNTRYFQVERSADGQRWAAAGTAPATGPGSYSFDDDKLTEKSTLLYRIRAVDHDGQETLSQTVELAPDSTTPAVTVWPNPARETLHIHTGTVAARIRLYDMAGKQILEYQCPENETAAMLSLDTLPAGVYQVEVIAGGVRTVQAVVRQ